MSDGQARIPARTAVRPPTDTGIVLLGHGSRDPSGAAEFLAVADGVRAALPDLPVEAGVLEFAGPVAPANEPTSSSPGQSTPGLAA